VQFDFPIPGTNGSPTRDLNGDGVADSLNFGFEGIQFGGRETRDAAIGVIQWEPSDRLRVLIDGYYSRFKSDVQRRGLRVVSPQSGDNQFINPVIANNALIGGRIVNQVGSNGFGFGLGPSWSIRTKAAATSCTPSATTWPMTSATASRSPSMSAIRRAPASSTTPASTCAPM